MFERGKGELTRSGVFGEDGFEVCHFEDEMRGFESCLFVGFEDFLLLLFLFLSNLNSLDGSEGGVAWRGIRSTVAETSCMRLLFRRDSS